VREAPVAARRVGQSDYGRGMEVAVRRDQVGADVQLRGDRVFPDGREANPYETGQPADAALVQNIERVLGT